MVNLGEASQTSTPNQTTPNVFFCLQLHVVDFIPFALREFPHTLALALACLHLPARPTAHLHCLQAFLLDCPRLPATCLLCLPLLLCFDVLAWWCCGSCCLLSQMISHVERWTGICTVLLLSVSTPSFGRCLLRSLMDVRMHHAASLLGIVAGPNQFPWHSSAKSQQKEGSCAHGQHALLAPSLLTNLPSSTGRSLLPSASF